MHVQLSPGEKRPIKHAAGMFSDPVTYGQALSQAKREMPADLRKAGFTASVFVSDPEINGGAYFVVNYSK